MNAGMRWASVRYGLQPVGHRDSFRHPILGERRHVPVDLGAEVGTHGTLD